jgi:signal transduction histidine kinase
VRAAFPGGEGQWGLRRSTFREGGVPHQLVVLSDLSRTLREEERQAWQRLIRVLGHELNNSLAPIKSMAATLRNHATRTPRASDWEDDLAGGLRLIETARMRSGASSAPTASSPACRGRTGAARGLDLGAAVVALEPRCRAEIVEGPDITLRADGDQLDQLLINLLRNAVDAALETGGGVASAGRARPSGRGPASRSGSRTRARSPQHGESLRAVLHHQARRHRIGLLLSRQIAEAHGGNLALTNREGGRGCRATLWLPLAPE